ncbi:MAG: hypothetical protein IJY93_00180 [Clostridia bacterium]|nr:hypothetical protein [Clostridia bacterium]
MKTYKRILSHALLFLTLIIVLWSTLILGAMIPNESLQSNFIRSAEVYKEKEPYTFNSGEKLNSIADNYADSILLNIAWNMGSGTSPIVSTLNTRYYDGEALGENIGLYKTVTENAEPNTDYTRYWHGTSGIVRAFHLFTDVNGIRIIGLVCLLVLVLVTVVTLTDHGHIDIAAFLLISLAAVHIWNVRLSMEYQSVFIVTFLLCPLFLILERKSDNYLTLLCVASGTLVAFFDFLTTETITLLLPLILVIAVRTKENRLSSLKVTLLLLLKCALCWGAAYIGTFLIKWTAASVAMGENAFSLALSSVGERIGGAVDTQVKPTSLFSSIAANLTVLTGGTERVDIGRIALVFIPLALVLFSVWYLLRTKKPNRSASVSLLLLTLPVFARYLILNNHSYIHEFFTYRALVSPILAILLLVWFNIELPGTRKDKRK